MGKQSVGSRWRWCGWTIKSEWWWSEYGWKLCWQNATLWWEWWGQICWLEWRISDEAFGGRESQVQVGRFAMSMEKVAGESKVTYAVRSSTPVKLMYEVRPAKIDGCCSHWCEACFKRCFRCWWRFLLPLDSLWPSKCGRITDWIWETEVKVWRQLWLWL